MGKARRRRTIDDNENTRRGNLFMLASIPRSSFRLHWRAAD
jgi:hypothetical protein